MDTITLAVKAKRHLNVLCNEIGERRVGGEANIKATDYLKKVLKNVGWVTTETRLDVIDWESKGTTLTCDGETFEAESSEYSNGFNGKGILVAIGTVSQLESTNIKDKIVLLHSEIASQQLAPKNFPFWNPEDHQHIISQLEKGEPKAIICATERNSSTAGGVYPFPLIEDGDFDIPSVYMKDTEGFRLVGFEGKEVELISKARRIPSTAYNITALKNPDIREKIVISAHIDTKIGTTGAIDNATGVTTILLLAEIIKDLSFKYQIELAFFNGEDYYAAPGQLKYIEQNQGNFENVLLNINIDGAAYKEGLSSFSPFDLPANMDKALKNTISNNPGIVEGLPWFQGDHSMFLQSGRPAIAVSSQWFIENMDDQDITHTPKDNLSIVDYNKVAECAIAIKDFLCQL
jgi:aminopeptidase YwaD